MTEPTTDAWTLHAKHDDGRDLVFVDFVSEGATVDLFDDPHEEIGFRGAGVVYRDGADWRMRELTDSERMARVDRLLAQAQRRDLPRHERLIDPAARAGGLSA